MRSTHETVTELPALPDMPFGLASSDQVREYGRLCATRQPALVTLSVAVAVNDQGSTVIVSQHRGGIQTVLYCQTHQPGYEGLEIIKLDAIAAASTKLDGGGT